jgi:hypothetical protein
MIALQSHPSQEVAFCSTTTFPLAVTTRRLPPDVKLKEMEVLPVEKIVDAACPLRGLHSPVTIVVLGHAKRQGLPLDKR